MSLTSSLNNALSGLSASSRGVEMVSNNVANALTEGYTQKELVLTSRVDLGTGAGVRVEGIKRRVDPPLIALRRTAEAGAAGSDARAGGLEKIETAFGIPGAEGALTTLIDTMDAALISAISRPDLGQRLDIVATSARNVTGALNAISDTIQTVRQDANNIIARDVTTLNASLREIETLDIQIASLNHGNRDVTALQDQRQLVVDKVNAIVPVREMTRQGGRIALYSIGGALLYDGRPVQVEFSPHQFIQPDLTYAGGDLSGLSIDGVALRLSGPYSQIRGGTLAAQFDLRDSIAPQAQTALDAMTRDLIERFQDPVLDSTLAVGDAGIFTDRGMAFDATDEVGIAGRIALNTSVDPAQGGNSWRLRDGIGAATQGNVGNATLLNALADHLGALRTPASGPFSGTQRTTAALAADVLSAVSTARQAQERDLVYNSTRFDTLKTQELGGAVDTDEEMRHLLLLEQAYTANARVIQTIDDLMQTLLGI